MALFSTSTRGYGTSNARTSGRLAGRGFTPAHTPEPQNLPGRTQLATTQRAELDNTRLKQDLDLDRKRFDANEQQRALGNARYDELKNALTGFQSALPSLPGPGGSSIGGAAIPLRVGAGGGVSGPGAAVDGAGAPPAGNAGQVRDLARGRAKENIGLSLQSALRGLQGALVDTGRGGGAFENAAIGDLFESGLSDLARVESGLMEDELDRAYDVEDRNFAGDITQRSQDIGVMGQERSLAAQREQAALDRLATLLGRFQTQGAIY